MEILETMEFDYGNNVVASVTKFRSISICNMLATEIICESYDDLKF